ncbi:MAG TPA: YicC family protein [Parvularcula sp.]|nr:YicC family protein [Parvularcula sp.]HBS31277.1 YicC family protein [Parvularcula sp.]HBS34944.1 YicC family protein [Parvularcula sp.]
MALSSMTGFARGDGASGETRWTWELKSVNGRGLEPRFRLPPGLDFLEQDLRKALSEKFSRGSFNAFLSLKGAAVEGGLTVNRAALSSAIALVEEIRGRIACDPPRPEGVLALRGVVDVQSALDNEDERAALGAKLAASFAETSEALLQSRRREGAALEKLILDLLAEIERLCAAARDAAAAATAATRDRFAAQLADLLASSFSEERLAQEAAALAVKSDVREELDRLSAHIEAARALIAKGAAAGRQLDFLTQELNREANTLCSKAQDMGLKRIGLDLKTAVDRMREQVQNVE